MGFCCKIKCNVTPSALSAVQDKRFKSATAIIKVKRFHCLFAISHTFTTASNHDRNQRAIVGKRDFPATGHFVVLGKWEKPFDLQELTDNSLRKVQMASEILITSTLRQRILRQRDCGCASVKITIISPACCCR